MTFAESVLADIKALENEIDKQVADSHGQFTVTLFAGEAPDFAIYQRWLTARGELFVLYQQVIHALETETTRRDYTEKADALQAELDRLYPMLAPLFRIG